MKPLDRKTPPFGQVFCFGLSFGHTLQLLTNKNNSSDTFARLLRMVKQTLVLAQVTTCFEVDSVELTGYLPFVQNTNCKPT